MAMKDAELFAKTADEILREVVATMPAEERLRGMPAEERLRGMPAEERLRGMPAEERLAGLSVEEMERLQHYLAQLQKSRT